MSIIIVAQSLKNDGSADIQIDGEFAPPPEKQQELNTFDKNGRNTKFKKCCKHLDFGILPGLLPIDSIFGFILNGEEKDNMGRNSPIGIQAKLTELEDIIPNFKHFLQKSGRTVSTEKMECLKRKIEHERKTLKALIRNSIVFVVDKVKEKIND